MADSNLTAIDGNLIPLVLEAVAELLEQHRDPTRCKFVFDAEKEELRIIELIDSTSNVVHTVPY